MGDVRSRAVLVVVEPPLATQFAAVLTPAMRLEVTHSAVEAHARVARAPDFRACVISATLPDGKALLLAHWLDATCPAQPLVLVAPALTPAVAQTSLALGAPVTCGPPDAAALEAYVAQRERRARAQVEAALRSDVGATIAQAGLTPREQAICWKSVLGADSKEIAAEERVQVSTVYAHQTSIRRKLGLATIDDLRWRVLRRVLPDWRR